MPKVKKVDILAYGEGIIGDAIEFISEQCIKCKHINDETYQICKAFPDGIPEEILAGEVDHTNPYPGDHGITFEERKESRPRKFIIFVILLEDFHKRNTLSWR